MVIEVFVTPWPQILHQNSYVCTGFIPPFQYFSKSSLADGFVGLFNDLSRQNATLW